MGWKEPTWGAGIEEVTVRTRYRDNHNVCRCRYERDTVANTTLTGDAADDTDISVEKLFS